MKLNVIDGSSKRRDNDFVDVLILAAGKGTRMPSAKPKVLQTLLGETMLSLVHATVSSLPEVARVWTVIGHEADMVRAELEYIKACRCTISAWFSPEDPVAPECGILCIEQREQRGTGHALKIAMPYLPQTGEPRHVLVVNGDTPLLTADILHGFLKEAGSCDVAFLTLSVDDAGSYGRVVRHNGQVRAIVEARDYVPELHGENPREINPGVYLISFAAAHLLLPKLSTANKSGEYYITDLVELAVAHGLQVMGVPVEHLPGVNWGSMSLMGVNNPGELADAEALLQKRRVMELISAGVIIHSPMSVRVGPFVRVEPGAELFGPCEIYGHSFVGFGAVVESHCVIINSSIAGAARVRSFCHLERARVDAQCIVGPYARLRPEAHMEEGSHAGNFVEIKKSRLGKGSKANHLTYLGDADIGPGVNIGAGTITCNYDGKHKHRTVIGKGSFIGSNTALVAPVNLGENSMVGAGSVITKDVPDDTLAVARGRQANIKRH